MSKTLMVYLAADTDRFRREMRRADDSIDNLGKRSMGLGGMMGNLGTAMAGAAVGAGALAVALGVEGVKAFMDDERAAASLAITLKNLGLGEATGAVEQFIDAQQRLTGVSDEKLRPSMDRLLRSTRSVKEAQDLLKLAMDISAGSGKSLDTVTQALARAHDGNTGALGKLGTGLDNATLKSGNFQRITKDLAKTFEGQAAAAADTLIGKMDKLAVSFDEMKESFGRGFITGMEKASGSVSDLSADLATLEAGAGALGSFIGETAILGLKQFSAAFIQMSNAIDAIKKGDFAGAIKILGQETKSFLNDFSMSNLGGGDNLLTATQATAAAAEDARRQVRRFLEEVKDGKDDVIDYGGALDQATAALDAQRLAVSQTASELKTAADEVKNWTDQIIGYKNSLTDTILSVDLRAAFEQQGKEGGLSLLDAFRGQLSDAKNFAGLLKQMKEAGASQALIDEVAGLGAQAGGELAQQLLDEGLVKTISDEWDKARAEIFDVTSTLVPDFLIQGQNNALAMLEGLTSKTREEEATLRAIGKEMGKPIGAEIKAAVAAAMADALAAAKAAAAAVTIPTSPATAAGVPEATGVVPIVPATTYTDFSTSYNLTNVLAQAQNRGGIIGDGINLVFQ